MDSWDHCRTFLAVLGEGSLSGAARRLGLTQPTIGRHIEALESELGLPLFIRSVGGLAPTDAALSLKTHAEAMAASADALVRTASGAASSVSGTIRIAAAEVVGVEVLPPILTRLHQTYSELALELVLSNQHEDLSRREADIAVRMVRPTQGALIAQKVGSVQVGLYIHKRSLETYGRPDRMDQPGFAAIGFDRDLRMVRALRDSKIPIARESFAFRSDNDLAQLAALRAGFGVGACQAPIARRDPNLVPVLEDAFHFEMEIWVAMHEDLKTSRRMRLTFDWLVEDLGVYIRS